MEKLRNHFAKHEATYLVGCIAAVSTGALILLRVIAKNDTSTTNLMNASILQERANMDCWHGQLHDYMATNPPIVSSK